jgi:hypothetical protein
MKAILEFNLPEDKVDFDLALQGSDWKHVCWEMDQLLRKHLKYDDDLKEDEVKMLQYVRDEFHQFMIDNNLDLYAAE